MFIIHDIYMIYYYYLIRFKIDDILKSYRCFKINDILIILYLILILLKIARLIL